MHNYEIGIPIIIEAFIGFASSLFFILDISIHYKMKLYQLELGILYTNLMQSIITILLIIDFNNQMCIWTLFLEQCLTLSSFLWTILILQKSCLLTRYPIQIALEYLKTNQFTLQAIIAFGLPIIASSLIFVKLNICQLDILTQVSTKLFWAIQSILTIIFIGIITYHIIRVHLNCKLAKLYIEILYCPIILIFSLPWIVYTIFNFELDDSEDVKILQVLFFLDKIQHFKWLFLKMHAQYQEKLIQQNMILKRKIKIHKLQILKFVIIYVHNYQQNDYKIIIYQIKQLMEFIQSLLSLFGNIAIVALMLTIGILGLLYIQQNSLIYLPAFQGLPQSPSQNMNGLRNPSERNLQYEDVEIGTLDRQKLKGWLIKQNDSINVPTVIFLHENAGNIGTRLQFLELYFSNVKCNILIIAYRGYSDSTGKPSEQGLQLDGESIVNYLFHRNDIDSSKIFVHGKSLGGAVAIHAMTQNIAKGIRGVILENTFTSIDDMVDVIFPKLKFFKSILLKNHWLSIQKIGQITQPILFIYSMRDEIVPVQHMAQLQNAAQRAKFIEKFVIEDGDHNTNWSREPEKYFNSISSFINKAITS
ncbi:unnamed protein product [Paramecium primaurelia]|uniref:Peptidase S9 prolyl oligopeptidase catalytic domain-containing protein n=1 Tax=Paramecium primaurelia TaxID=5886 RepID=A0A8S1KEV2_PARPR|nr:unnamed protein product [Paramecium primaurelia]